MQLSRYANFLEASGQQLRPSVLLVCDLVECLSLDRERGALDYTPLFLRSCSLHCHCRVLERPLFPLSRR